MIAEVLMPALSPTMTEGNLAKWLKRDGDKVKSGDVLAEIETDKAVMEVESVDDGILKIVIPEGSKGVKVNQLIAVLYKENTSQEEIEKLIASHNSSFVSIKVEDKKEERVTTPEKKDIAQSTPAKISEERLKASPLARRIAEQERIDINNIAGTGPGGRIIKDDVLGVKTKGVSVSGSKAPQLLDRQDKVIEISQMRKVIAARLQQSKRDIPHFYLTVAVDMTDLMKIRAELNADAEIVDDKPSYRISVNDFVIKAAALALSELPEANASWNEDEIIQYGNVDVSVAVAIPGGLITPIIFSADQKGIIAVSNEMKSLIKRAKAGSLKPHEFQGGSFSISNLGMYGIEEFKAIINPPQSSMLAVGAAGKKPVVHNGELKIAEVMKVSLSCDHRVIDGAVGAELLGKIKKYLEKPYLMLKY